MSVAVTTTAASTVPPAALTTPFVQSPECAGIWDLTSSSWKKPYDSTSTTHIVLASDAADPRFASCQPSGWDGGASSFTFSPAVCPSGWEYQQMATMNSSGAVVSTAFCCASGYTRTPSGTVLIPSMTMPCVRRFDSAGATTITGTLSHGTGPTALFTSGIQAHEAWHISWAASDTHTLSPSLPELTSNMFVPTWTPGETIPAGEYDNVSRTSHPDYGGLFYFFVIGIPLIGLTVIGLGAWCCVRAVRSRRRERERERLAAAQQPAATRQVN